MNIQKNTNNYLRYNSNDPLTQDHTHIIVGNTARPTDLYLAPATLDQAKRKIVLYNLSVQQPICKSLANTLQAFPNPDPAPTLLQSWTAALHKTYREGEIVRTVGTIAFVVASVAISVFLFGACARKIESLRALIGTQMLVYTGFNTIPTYTTYTEVNFKAGKAILSVITGLAIAILGVGSCVAILTDPCLDNFLSRETHYGYVKALKIQTNDSPLAEKDLSDISNAMSENGSSIEEPIHFSLIEKEKLKAPATLLIGKFVYTADSALNVILNNKRTKNRQSGQIPHPIEDRVMTSTERSCFLDDLAALICLEPETIGNCWNSVDEEEVKLNFATLPNAALVYPRQG